MNTQEKKLLENVINNRLQRLQIILAVNNAEDAGRDSNQDESARLDQLNQIPVDETLINCARQEKSQLLNNLDWVRSDEAGLCQECGNIIPLERLLIVPTTRYCIACAKSDDE